MSSGRCSVLEHAWLRGRTRRSVAYQLVLSFGLQLTAFHLLVRGTGDSCRCASKEGGGGGGGGALLDHRQRAPPGESKQATKPENEDEPCRRALERKREKGSIDGTITSH